MAQYRPPRPILDPVTVSDLPPLVTTADPDYEKFKAGDEDYLLRVASDAMRDYCGWHLSPSITETYRQLRLGSQGLVMLPSRYVTDVSQVVSGQVIDPSAYEWFPDGWIQLASTVQFCTVALVDVTMTHGYAELPANLKQIAFELAQQTATSSGLISGVRSIKSPQYSADFTDAVKAGMSFSDEQLSTLNDYRLDWVA